MTNVTLTVNNVCAHASKTAPITSGLRQIPVKVILSDDWQGITPMLIAVGYGEPRRMAIDAEGNSSIPWEVVKARNVLKIGIWGQSADGSVVIPTLWADLGMVDPSPDDVNPRESEPVPTPDIVEQIAQLAYGADEKAQSVVDRADAGEFVGPPGPEGPPGKIDEGTIKEAVEDYLEQHPVEAPVQSVNGQTGAVSLTAHDVDTYNTEEIRQKLAGKQDKIDDLATIRAGAAKGATALQSYTETDPTVPNWAKQPNKPTYTAAEVGALPASTPIPPAYDDTQIKEDLSQLEQTINGKYTKPNTGIPASDLAAGVIPPAVTDEHINSLIDDKLPTIPQKLPTPNKLIFTGAATGEFDGSSPLTVNIPSGGGEEKQWRLLADVDCAEVPGNIIVSNLDGLTEIYAEENTVVNASSTASAYTLVINDVTCYASCLIISKAGTAWHRQYMYAKFIGVGWMCLRSNGTVTNNQAGTGPQCVNQIANGVGKAESIQLSSPISAYQAVSGNIKIWGR